MIYHFVDLDTLRLAVTSGVVPTDVSLAPALGGLDDDGHIWLQPSVALPRKAQSALRNLGVEVVKANGDFQAEEVCCWLQMLPVVRADTEPPSPQTPVLFELADAEQLPVLVSEMLRLGNDRQSFRWLKDDAGNRVLLRVVGPPYYSLLRALERDGPAAAPRAYVERSPRVWVEIGHTHPLVEQIRPKEGRFLLMRAPRAWAFVEDAPFQDIYDILDFKLPTEQVSWQPAEVRSRLQVPVRLAPGGTTEPPELWVLRDDALGQVDTLVREKDDHFINQLSFAVAEGADPLMIVLRVRPSKQAPPVLVLKGESFRPFSKMPNLFLPHGRRLQPPLRRDVVRKLLADDPDLVTWLYPGPDDSFTPQSMPDAAFRPLRDWVEYVIDRDHQAIQTWIAAARFDFESFVCRDDQAPAPPKKPKDRKRDGDQRNEPDDVDPAATPVVVKPAPKSRRKEVEDEFAPPRQVKPSELQERLGALEKRFLEIDSALDARERQALWPEMAAINGALGQTADGAICWLNALWEHDAPLPVWPRAWAKSETKANSPDGATLDRLLAHTDPPASEVRALIACVVAVPEVVQPRLASVRQYLEKHEGRVGIRAVWLAWCTLTRLSAGDVLGLARVRDRLLDRLLSSGLSPEYDLPSFLRFAGQRSSDRFRAVRDQLMDLRKLALKWIGGESSTRGAGAQTPAYADLIFAFGLARIGEASECRNLLAKAEARLKEGDNVHAFLLWAYQHRIQQLLEGKPHTGPLPQDQLEFLTTLERFALYKVDRLRHHSRILEPQETIDPYRKWYAPADELSRELTALADVNDRQKLVERFAQLRRDAGSKKALFQVLSVALGLAPRVSESFTVDMLERFGPVYDALPPMRDQRELEDRAKVLERALFLAAHYDRSEHVQGMVTRFLKLLESQRGEDAAQALDALAGQCFRGLRKVGLKDEIDQLLHEMASQVMQKHDLPSLRKRRGVQWPTALRTLLQVAAGWFYFGRNEKALPVLAEAQTLLFEGELIPPERTKLACTYAAAVGQAPVDFALQRFMELFRKLGRINDTYTTNSHYSVSQLQIIEAVVLAVVSDDFNMSQNARRWLDEDEYLVRRRIHRDLRALMAQSGV